MRKSSVIIAALLLGGIALQGEGLPKSSPKSQGMSPARLQRVSATAQRFVNEKKHSGVITLIARNGKVVQSSAHGYRDIEAQKPMEMNTICRIYSMSKLITSVAVLKLVEDGKVLLDDPVEKYWPELAARKVIKGGNASSPELQPAGRSVTVRHLLTHTAGYVYDFSAGGAAQEIYRSSKMWETKTMPEFIAEVAKLPLVHVPGEKYAYGINTDILGAIVEKASGQVFEDYLHDAIFKPLKMNDTSFDVPENKRDRLAKTYQRNSEGKLVEAEPIIGTHPTPGMQSGGGGLFSTIEDYSRFAQMLVNGGELDGARILSPKTIELMTQNHLTRLDPPHLPGNPSRGFGLGPEVVIELAHASTLGSPGQYGWYGAATTYCQIDPKEKLIAIAFAQHFPFNQANFFTYFANSYYQAITK